MPESTHIPLTERTNGIFRRRTKRRYSPRLLAFGALLLLSPFAACPAGFGQLANAVIPSEGSSAALRTTNHSRGTCFWLTTQRSVCNVREALLGTQASPTPEHKISPAQATELFRSVDEILKFASTETALPQREIVKRKLVSRDEVVAYLQKHMDEDEDSQRFRRSEAVLKKFGLVPRDFDLRPFLIGLLREQIAGYYDPSTKTVNLLNWLDAEQQKPVLAHELTHALQDQSFEIEKWIKGSTEDTDKKKNDPSPADIENDEETSARQAVVEGQAMVVLLDYSLAPTGKTLLDSPQIVEALKQGMLVGTADSPAFRDAPIF